MGQGRHTLRSINDPVYPQNHEHLQSANTDLIVMYKNTRYVDLYLWCWYLSMHKLTSFIRSANNRQQLNATHISRFCTSLNTGTRCYFLNSSIMIFLLLESIQSIVRRRRLSLFGHVARMYRPKQFCAWHAMSEMEFHPSQTGADHGAVLLSPGCTRSVQTAVCPLETPSTALRIGPRGERTLRPPRPCVDDDDEVISSAYQTQVKKSMPAAAFHSSTILILMP